MVTAGRSPPSLACLERPRSGRRVRRLCVALTRPRTSRAGFGLRVPRVPGWQSCSSLPRALGLRWPGVPCRLAEARGAAVPCPARAGVPPNSEPLRTSRVAWMPSLPRAFAERPAPKRGASLKASGIPSGSGWCRSTDSADRLPSPRCGRSRPWVREARHTEVGRRAGKVPEHSPPAPRSGRRPATVGLANARTPFWVEDDPARDRAAGGVVGRARSRSP